MLITEKFVYIHQPKTGGTFVAATLANLHQRRGDRVETIWIDPAQATRLPALEPGVVLRLMFTTRNQHGARKDIPVQYAGRPVVATIRNPYDRYVSQFAFAWWRRYPEMFGPVEATRQRYPNYPDLTFDEYVELTSTVSVPFRAPRHPDDTPGFQTQQFVEYFFADPDRSYPRLVDPAFTRERAAVELAGIRFLDQHRLNQQLHDFLREMDYTAEELAAVRTAAKILPPEGGRTPEQGWCSYYSPELKSLVRRKEHLLFEWFPEFDV